MIKTDRDAGDCWQIYALLTRAEDAFRDMKTPLAERLIYHQNERRVESHIFLCVLAFHLLVAIEKTLLDQGRHTSWANVRDTLKPHQVCTIVLPIKTGQTLRILGEPCSGRGGAKHQCAAAPDRPNGRLRGLHAKGCI
jgi:hypothetical protein